MEIDKLAFESKEPDRGYTIRASYLKAPDSGDALVEIFKDGQPLRQFRLPAYKVWNIAAHFRDIVDGEIEQNASGYKMAAWDGISGAVVVTPNARSEPTARLFAQVGSTDGLGVAVPPTPTLEQGEKK